jgi:hypothetical protein
MRTVFTYKIAEVFRLRIVHSRSILPNPTEILYCNIHYNTVSVMQSFKAENKISLNLRHVYSCTKQNYWVYGQGELIGGVFGDIQSVELPGFPV